jgi:CheY-like chemotaxis protein
MKPRVLWIEDSARLELTNLTGPIYFAGKYDFNMAEDVTTAVSLLQSEEFDVVIVDIRLPPGIDPQWSKLYRRMGADKIQAQLGLQLLRWMLSGDRSIYASQPPNWIKPIQVGVFTVESPLEIREDLEHLKVKTFQQKVAGLPDTILLDLIDRLLEQSSAIAA